MAIVFPRAMPDVGPGDQYFEPESLDFLSPEASGRQGGVQAGQTLWVARWSLGTLSRLRAEEWRAWIVSLRGPKRPFLGRDYQRPMPLMHPSFAGMTRAVGGVFDGTATSWSVDGTGGVVTLNGLPAGFVMSVGDYVGFTWETLGQQRWALVRATEGRVATIGSAGFAIEPAVPACVPPDAVAYLNNPVCLMRLVPGDTRITPMNRRLAIGAAISAIQDLRA